jgi:hypothetical protein
MKPEFWEGFEKNNIVNIYMYIIPYLFFERGGFVKHN